MVTDIPSKIKKEDTQTEWTITYMKVKLFGSLEYHNRTAN